MNTNDYMENSPKLVADFLRYMQAIQGKSKNTILEYALDLRTLFRYLVKKRNPAYKNTEFEEIDISDVDIDFIRKIEYMDIIEFLNYCTEERKNQAVSRSRKVSSIRSFFKYLNKINLLNNNPVEQLETPKKRKKVMKYLTLEESINLLNSIDGKNRERDYCIITLFLNCGMRLSELVNIDINDIRSDNSLKLLGKGNKERIVYLNYACISAIKNYMAVRPNNRAKDKNALFISAHYNRISPKTVQYIVYKYLHSIGLHKGYSTHKLRHTAATLMYQNGNVDIRVLKEILGHENLSTTEIYTHLSNKKLEDAAKANPLSNIKKKSNN